jgi:2-methylisocitrate lyase-like PEP mutase family enzyme
MTSALLDSPAARPYGPGDDSKLGGVTMSVLTKGPLPVTAPLVLNPLMVRMVEAAGFDAGYLGGDVTP